MKKLKSNISANALDLHGTKHADTKQIVINFIEIHWDMDIELTIITGNSPIMKGIVLDVLDEYKLDYRQDQFCYGKLTTWI